jgi:hypothetical protein
MSFFSDLMSRFKQSASYQGRTYEDWFRLCGAVPTADTTSAEIKAAIHTWKSADPRDADAFIKYLKERIDKAYEFIVTHEKWHNYGRPYGASALAMLRLGKKCERLWSVAPCIFQHSGTGGYDEGAFTAEIVEMGKLGVSLCYHVLAEVVPVMEWEFQQPEHDGMCGDATAGIVRDLAPKIKALGPSAISTLPFLLRTLPIYGGGWVDERHGGVIRAIARMKVLGPMESEVADALTTATADGDLIYDISNAAEELARWNSSPVFRTLAKRRRF